LKGENAINAYGMKGNGNLKVVDKVGTAVFMLTRKAVDCLIQNATPYSRNPMSRGRNEDIPHYDVFRTAVVDGQYLSEDYFVCDTLQKNGFDVYVDTSVATRHNGNYVFIWEG
jgi:hypothetical protein